MVRMKANQLPALAQTSANILCPGRGLTGVTVGQLAQTIKFRRYSLSAPRLHPRAGRQHGRPVFRAIASGKSKPVLRWRHGRPIDNAQATCRRTPAAVGMTKIHRQYEFQPSNPEKKKSALGVSATR
jgi:hypothetical protein